MRSRTPRPHDLSRVFGSARSVLYRRSQPEHTLQVVYPSVPVSRYCWVERNVCSRRMNSLATATSCPIPDVNVNRDLLNRWKKPGDELHTIIPSLPGQHQVYISLPNGENGISHLCVGRVRRHGGECLFPALSADRPFVGISSLENLKKSELATCCLAPMSITYLLLPANGLTDLTPKCRTVSCPGPSLWVSTSDF